MTGITVCVTAPGGNEGAGARKLHVVDLGVDVVVRTGAWEA